MHFFGLGDQSRSPKSDFATMISLMAPDNLSARTRTQRTSARTSAFRRVPGFKSLRDTWLDTTSPHGRLMLTVLGGLTDFERELIRARTAEGRRRVGFGRRPKLTPQRRLKALSTSARSYNVSHGTISRL